MRMKHGEIARKAFSCCAVTTSSIPPILDDSTDDLGAFSILFSLFVLVLVFLTFQVVQLVLVVLVLVVLLVVLQDGYIQELRL